MLTFLRTRLLWLAAILPLLLSAPDAFTQNAPAEPKSKQQVKAEKKKQKKAEQAQRSENDAKQRHINIQEKEVRKRMKRSRKEAERVNHNRRKPFYERWFVRRRSR